MIAPSCITILGGRDKAGGEETLRLDLRPGDVVGLVGPTGSGKTRFLADIEWMARGDTPTGRHVLLDGEPAGDELRSSPEAKLVAHLSQNMNFVVDLPASEFVAMHAEARGAADPAAVAQEVIARANELAGERFRDDTPVTALSGGQSRALMIADAALVSSSPIVLIDEIENAGIERRRALEVLVGRGKIVLVATHDPILALQASRRLVFRNGAVAAVLETSAPEQAALAALDALDRRLGAVRAALRRGERIEDG